MTNTRQDQAPHNTILNPHHPYWIDFSALYQRSDTIARAYDSRNLVFFLGAGASKHYAPLLPGWAELMEDLLNQVGLGNPSHLTEINGLIGAKRYPLAAEAIKQYAFTNSLDKDIDIDRVVARIIRQRIERSTANPLLHLAILDFSMPIFTTNYDAILELLLEKYQPSSYRRTAITYQDEADAAEYLNPWATQESFVFKLHGSIDRTQHLILDERDYANFYFRAYWPASLQLLRHTLTTKMVVFVGFSLSDPEINFILREATRYASSYQHLALLNEAETTPIELDSLRLNYRVDSVLYKDHAHLPLFIMEMHNFVHREGLPLQLSFDAIELDRAITMLQKHEGLPNDCTTILFGSYAKYGKLTPQTDIDVLFLTDEPVNKSRIRSSVSSDVFGRHIDGTVLQHSEFRRLLHSGDPFASSVLVTGSPMKDQEGNFEILSRGFRGRYEYKSVLENAWGRYQTRWLRLCVYENASNQEFFQACYQWALTLMQYLLIDSNYPVDNLLSISLLGNARFTFREFAKRFKNINEDEYISLMYAAKGISDVESLVRPKIWELIERIKDDLGEKYNSKLSSITPGDYLELNDSPKITAAYIYLSEALKAFTHGDSNISIGYANTSPEKYFLSRFRVLQVSTRNSLTIFDCLFFFRLHDVVMREGTLASLGEERLAAIVEKVRKGLWRK